MGIEDRILANLDALKIVQLLKIFKTPERIELQTRFPISKDDLIVIRASYNELKESLEEGRIHYIEAALIDELLEFINNQGDYNE